MSTPQSSRALTMRLLLHRGGSPGTWGNLGLWGDEPGDQATDYATACAALARAVGRAAGITPGDRVLSVACGAGDELLLWSREFGAAQVLGVEADATLAGAAQALSGATVRQGSGAALASLGLASGSFDRVVCVDAAYHLQPRSAFLQGVWPLLRPGGTLAYTDLVVSGSALGFKRAMLMPSVGLLGGIAPRELLDEAGQSARLQAAGFAGVQLQRLDDAVLGGFVRFIWRHGLSLGALQLSPSWRRPALTAGCIGPCRSFGLGYALVSATRPAAVAAASMAAAAA